MSERKTWIQKRQSNALAHGTVGSRSWGLDRNPLRFVSTGNPILGRGSTYSSLDNLANITSSRLQDSLEILAALLGLLGNRARHQVPLAVGGDLARDPDLTGGLDGVAVRAGSCKKVIRQLD